MTSIRTFLEAIRMLLRNRAALVVFAVLYAFLLATLYIFVATREATVWQVVITLLFLVLIPTEFFVLQAAIVTYARVNKFQWRQILGTAVKLFVITLPIFLLGYALWVLLNKWQLRFPPPTVLVFSGSNAPPLPQPLHWPALLFATLRCLLFGVALPLATIHLWIEVAAHDLSLLVSGGAGTVFKRLGNVCARAFASDSVLTYAIGLVLFVAIPYAVLFVHISAKGVKTAFAVFITQLALAFAFTLVGWIATLGALTRTSAQTTAVVTSVEIPAEAVA